EPLLHIEFRTKQQRRFLVEQPLHDLERSGRIRPRLGMAHRDLTTIGEAGFQARCRLAGDDTDTLAAPQCPISRIDADDASTKHDNIKIVRRRRGELHLRLPGLRTAARLARRGRPLCHRPESFIVTGDPASTYTVGGSTRAPLSRVLTCERFFCLRVSGAVAPSAPLQSLTNRSDLSRSANTLLIAAIAVKGGDQQLE